MSAPILPTDNPPSTTARKILFRWIERLMLLYGAALTLYLVVWLVAGERWNIIALVNNLIPWLAGGAALISLGALFSRYRWRLIGAQIPILVAFAVLYGDLYWPRPPVTVPDGAPITAANFNVLAGDSDPEQISAVITALDADLIGLEEMGWEHAAFFEQHLALDYPYQIACADNTDLGLLSRYPILEWDTLPLTADSISGPFDRVLRAVVEVERKRVIVFVAHPPIPAPLSAVYQGGIPVLWTYDAAPRDDQLARLGDYARAEQGPVLVLCDCNVTDQADGYRTLDAVLDDSFREVGRGLGFSHRSTLLPSWFPKLWRIDYIWHDESFAAIRVRVNDENGTSDHYPVIAQLVLKAAAVDQAKRG